MYRNASRFQKWSSKLKIWFAEEDEPRDTRTNLLEALRAAADTRESFDGSITRIEPYGVFVDGEWGHGLVHISELSKRFVRDPHDVVEIGQAVRVWVLGVDERNRVSLSMLPPSTEDD